MKVAMAYHKVQYWDLLFSLQYSCQFTHFLNVSQSPLVRCNLCISFQYGSYAESVSRLEADLSSIADWVTSNFLCLNSAKIEFLLLGLLKPQLNKIHNHALALFRPLRPVLANLVSFLILLLSGHFCRLCVFLPHS